MYHDRIGNQTRRPGVDLIDYTAFDLLKAFHLSQGDTVELDYDGLQRRIRKTAADRVSVYFEDLYERVDAGHERTHQVTR